MSISDLIQSTQPMNHEIAQRPDQHTGNSMPYSLRLVCGFFNVPQGYEHGSVVSEKTRKMFLLSYLKTLSVGPAGV